MYIYGEYCIFSQKIIFMNPYLCIHKFVFIELDNFLSCTTCSFLFTKTTTFACPEEKRASTIRSCLYFFCAFFQFCFRIISSPVSNINTICTIFDVRFFSCQFIVDFPMNFKNESLKRYFSHQILVGFISLVFQSFCKKTFPYHTFPEMPPSHTDYYQ